MKDNPARKKGLLDGVRVLDLTSVVYGCYATQMLGDLGADVVKVEQPENVDGQGGDILRWAGPMPEDSAPGMGPLFMAYNRNKRSVCLNLKDADDRAACLRLAARSDIFMSNMRMAALERLGFGYDGIRAVKDDIIYVHASGFGSDGPYAGNAAYDEMIQGAAGLTDLYSRTYGTDEKRYMPMLTADKTSALFMTYATIAALYQKTTTGAGQFVEVPMFECITQFNLCETLFGHYFDPPTGQYGYQRVLNPNRRPYRTKDGWIGVAPYSDRNWRDFFSLADREEEFAADARFNTYSARISNIPLLYAMVEEITMTKTTEEWLPLLKEKSIPATRINALDEVLKDPHLVATGFFQRAEHPTQGTVIDMKHPVRFSGASTETRRLAPRIGEHTAEVFEEWDVEAPASVKAGV